MTTVSQVAVRLYALALRAFPSRHRAMFASEMVEAFDRGVTARVSERGVFNALMFILAAMGDTAAAGSGERRRERERGRQHEIRLGRRSPWNGLGRDLAHAARTLTKARTFSVVCVVSLGLGLGVVFSISLFLRGLSATPPGVQTDGLVELVVTPQGPLRAKSGDWAIETWSYPDFEDLRTANTGVTVTGWAVGGTVLRASDAEPRRVSTMYVSPDYFALIGVSPSQGRVFDPAGEDETNAPAVIVSHQLWEGSLGADPAIVGSSITLNRAAHVVIGVAPAGFGGHIGRRGATQADVWVPLREHPAFANGNGAAQKRDADWIQVVGRLSSDTSLADANGAIASVMSGLAERYPASNEHKGASVQPYSSTGANQRIEMAIIDAMFLSLAGMVLLVVCLNVAGMVLVRSATRERELAVRLALGASRGRLIRYLMSEAAVLALLGGLLSLAVVYGGAAGLARLAEVPIPDAWKLTPLRIALCFVMSLATTLVFGLMPAVRFSRTRVVIAIKDDAAGAGWRVGRVHRIAVAFQAGIALPFLVIGGLLINGARITSTDDLGFQPEGLFGASLSVSAAGYVGADAELLLQRVQDTLRQSASVTSVTVADGLPLDYNYRSTRVSAVDGATRLRAHTTRVGDNYLETLGIRLLRGRAIADRDRAGGDLVAVLSASLATRLFPGVEPVGQRIVSALQGTEEMEFTVVGVTADVAGAQMQTTRYQVLVPLAQHSSARHYLIARGAPGEADPQSMTGAVESAIVGLGPEFGRPTVLTGTALVRDNIDDLLQQSTIAGVVAAVALALSGLGIYGVVAFMVATRTREIGVKIALGATGRRVMGSVLVDALTLAVPGLIGGLLVAIFFVRQSGLLWFTLGVTDHMVYVIAAGAALAVALLASLSSARRAAAVQPLDAMRMT
ncbi:MAG: ABC transporter permease [Acidobacteria bacterium]|nr:ABC transporter permease [Acidobacteriota bacterium]